MRQSRYKGNQQRKKCVTNPQKQASVNDNKSQRMQKIEQRWMQHTLHYQTFPASLSLLLCFLLSALCSTPVHSIDTLCWCVNLILHVEWVPQSPLVVPSRVLKHVQNEQHGTHLCNNETRNNTSSTSTAWHIQHHIANTQTRHATTSLRSNDNKVTRTAEQSAFGLHAYQDMVHIAYPSIHNNHMQPKHQQPKHQRLNIINHNIIIPQHHHHTQSQSQWSNPRQNMYES